MEGFLHTLMARRVGELQHLVTEIIMRRNKDPAPMEEQSVREAPGLLQVAGRELLLKKCGVICRRSGASNVGEETERWPGADAQGRPGGLIGGGSEVGVATGQRVGHNVKTARPILDGEV